MFFAPAKIMSDGHTFFKRFRCLEVIFSSHQQEILVLRNLKNFVELGAFQDNLMRKQFEVPVFKFWWVRRSGGLTSAFTCVWDK
jgi:hypothetical protein